MRCYFIACFLMFSVVIGCSSAPKDTAHGTASDSIVPPDSTENTDQKAEAQPEDSDTVDSLSKDTDKLQRELIQYSAGPLTPKQEDEVETIKKKIQKKESKKANLELQKMLGEWNEE